MAVICSGPSTIFFQVVCILHVSCMFQPSNPVTCFEEGHHPSTGNSSSASIDDVRAPLLENIQYTQQHNPLTGSVTWAIFFEKSHMQYCNSIQKVPLTSISINSKTGAKQCFTYTCAKLTERKHT